MKNVISIFSCLLLALSVYGQVFWTEDFENSCLTGCLATSYGGWTETLTGTNGGVRNLWFVSCAENGNAAGACGTGCGTDETLHVGNQMGSTNGGFICPPGDCGAAYDAGGCGTCVAAGCADPFDPCFVCGFLGSCGLDATTSSRIESPTIDCSGESNITLSFVYMENGQGSTDNATLVYFDGTSWSTLIDLAKTPTATCSPQGEWTAFSTLLPASANNNPSVRIGFTWVNDDDGAGADPSFAVDDISLETPIILPVELISFNARKAGESVELEWQTATEIENSHFNIERSSNAIDYTTIGTVTGHGNSTTVHNYRFFDNDPMPRNYYRLRQVDFDLTATYSNSVHVGGFTDGNSSHFIQAPLAVLGERDGYFRLYSLDGREVYGTTITAGTDPNDFVLGDLVSGYYLAIVTTAGNTEVYKSKLFIGK